MPGGVPKKIDGYSIEHLLKTAADVVKKKTENSVVLDVTAEERIPKFERSELDLGKVLGRGGFCVVNEITKIKLKETKSTRSSCNSNNNSSRRGGGGGGFLDDADEHCIHNIVQDREFMHEHYVRKGRDYRYAIKVLQESSQKDAHVFVNGVVDLAVEARFLSVVRHPNIIKMRAMAEGPHFALGFFVVLDKLFDIMTTKITKWKKQKPKGLRKMMDRGGKKEIAFWVERVTVAYDLSCALKYLHDLCIVYRDLKPDNIGFDVRGDVKIFDFGLAKEYDPDRSFKDGTYKMTADTGSPRYMAPEVAQGKVYNQSVDVYSFSILLWSMLALETPFEGYTMNMFRKKVVEGGHRPKCESAWPVEMVEMMRKGWGTNLHGRPSMDDVSNVLRDEINRLSDEEVDEIMDASRKSELSAHRSGHAQSA